MLKYTVLFLFAFLATASITPLLEQNLFYVTPDNKISYQLFQSRAGIIAYSIESPIHLGFSSYIPQYTLINLESNNISVILTDIMTSCNQTASAFDRLHYHVATSSLVYYCTSNNSLLILNEEDFSVQSTVSTGVSDSFDEVKLTTDGDSIAILGMTGLLSATPAPSQLIIISMQTYEVALEIVFDQGLSSGEAVTGYVSNSEGSYVLTTKIDEGNNTLTVYSIIMTSNNYDLTSLVTSTSPINSTGYYGPQSILSEFFAIGNLIITNNLLELIIYDGQGTVIETIPGLKYKAFPNNSTTYNRVGLVSEYGSTDLYTHLANYSIIKISVDGADYTSTIIATASDMEYVVADQYSNSLLFTVDSFGANFTITNLVTSETFYTMVTYFVDMFITDATYSFIQNSNLFIFSTESDQLIATMQINYGYYFNQETNILYFMKAGSNQTCELTQVDLLTAESFVSSTLNTNNPYCQYGRLIQVVSSNQDAPQLAMSNYGGQATYTILSQTFGLINFVPTMNQEPNTILVDYDSMTVYQFTGSIFANNTSVYVYTYDSDSKNFTLQTSKNFSDLSYGNLYPMQDIVVLLPMYGGQTLATISIPSLSETTYPFSARWNDVTSFLDESGNTYIILSDYTYFGMGNEAPGILYSGQLQTLPEVNTYTVSAQAAGLCSYWIVDGMVTNFGLVRAYNICSDGYTMSSICV